MGNFPFVLEAAYEDCYLPMLEELERHERVRTGLHVSGPLLEWLEVERPEYVTRVADLCASGRMELLTSGRYEPVLPVLPQGDVKAQVIDFSEHLEGISGRVPRGLWLTERVWEPQLASTLADAGVDHVIVDDVHLLRAGVPMTELDRPWTTGDSGRTVRLLASSRRLRYMIPFSPVEEVMEALEGLHRAGRNMVFYGDDGEKFGVWPGTSDLCYSEGWLSRFFAALSSSPFVEMILPSEAASLPSGGPVFVPACSYAEMGEWTLSVEAASEYLAARETLSALHSEEMVDVLVPGGFWRNFQSIYPESAELQGRMISAMDPVLRSGLTEARQHLWRSQCNCAYWHGVFGGIYLPHLREALWRELSMAEKLSLRSLHGYPRIVDEDLDGDGRKELLVVTPRMSVLIRPNSGLTVTELTLVPDGGDAVPVGHVLSRVPESYHVEIAGSSVGSAGGNIHGSLPSKEDGLSGRLVVDRWRKCIFTDLRMPLGFGSAEWRSCSEGIEHFQDADWLNIPLVRDDRAIVMEGSCGSNGRRISRMVEIGLLEPELKTSAVYRSPGERVGLEICLNMMTGAMPDRYLRIGEERTVHMLGESGEAVGSSLEVVDLYRGVRVSIGVDGEADIWFTPIESVNRSESGFERVHQGFALFISHECLDDPCTIELVLRIEPYAD